MDYLVAALYVCSFLFADPNVMSHPGPKILVNSSTIQYRLCVWFDLADSGSPRL